MIRRRDAPAREKHAGSYSVIIASHASTMAYEAELVAGERRDSGQFPFGIGGGMGGRSVGFTSTAARVRIMSGGTVSGWGGPLTWPTATRRGAAWTTSH